MPELFDIIALANGVVLALQSLSDFGISPNIIQNQRGDEPDFLNTAWTLQVIRGFGLYLVCLLITRPVAQFYEDDMRFTEQMQCLQCLPVQHGIKMQLWIFLVCN